MRLSPGCSGTTTSACIRRRAMSAQCGLKKNGELIDPGTSEHNSGYGTRNPGARSESCRCRGTGFGRPEPAFSRTVNTVARETLKSRATAVTVSPLTSLARMTCRCASVVLGGRPMCVPAALARSWPARVRSMISSRSKSATAVTQAASAGQNSQQPVPRRCCAQAERNADSNHGGYQRSVQLCVGSHKPEGHCCSTCSAGCTSTPA